MESSKKIDHLLGLHMVKPAFNWLVILCKLLLAFNLLRKKYVDSCDANWCQLIWEERSIMLSYNEFLISKDHPDELVHYLPVALFFPFIYQLECLQLSQDQRI